MENLITDKKATGKLIHPNVEVVHWPFDFAPSHTLDDIISSIKFDEHFMRLLKTQPERRSKISLLILSINTSLTLEEIWEALWNKDLQRNITLSPHEIADYCCQNKHNGKLRTGGYSTYFTLSKDEFAEASYNIYEHGYQVRVRNTKKYDFRLNSEALYRPYIVVPASELTG